MALRTAAYPLHDVGVVLLELAKKGVKSTFGSRTASLVAASHGLRDSICALLTSSNSSLFFDHGL